MSSKSAPELASPRRDLVHSLSFRLTALYAVVTSLIVCLAAFVVYRDLEIAVDRADDMLLRENARMVDAILLQPGTDPRTLLLGIQGGRHSLGAQDLRFRIVDGKGKVVVETPGMAESMLPEAFPPAVDPSTDTAVGVDRAIGGGLHRLMTAELRSEVLGGADALLQLVLDRRAGQELLGRYRTLLLVVMTVGLFACAWIGHHLALRAIAPIRELAASMARIQAASLDERVVEAGVATELRPLLRSFNDLLARLEDSFRRLRVFSSNLAHELRTPINNLCGEIEIALTRPGSREDCLEVLRSCREEATSLSHIIDSLMFLAYAQLPGARIDKQPVAIGAELATVRDFYEEAAAEAGLALHVTDDFLGTFDLDRTMLQRALGNLIANSIAFTPAGGRIDVHAARRGAALVIAVSDTGRGIHRDQIPSLFEGLLLATGNGVGMRAGLGLGLSIVQSIMRLHHGSVSIESDEGRGCTVTLTFGGGAAREPAPWLAAAAR
jgi:two-component system heavy metal sensor histidine kinase CusS